MTPQLSLHASNHGSARSTVALVQRAEVAGLSRVWLSEDLFHRGAIPIAAASLVSTTRIGVGFGILAPQHRHPAALAMDVRSLVDLAPSRLTIGLGAGIAERAALIGQPASPPLTIVTEAVHSLRTLLSGGVLEQVGVLHQSHSLQLSGDCEGTVPPIYVAAVGPKALANAGRKMDGVILTMMCSREHARHAAGLVRAAASNAGAEVPVVAYLPIVVDDDGASARDRMRRTLADIISRWSRVEVLSKLFSQWSELDDERMRRISVAMDDGHDLRGLLPDRVVAQYCIAGTPNECRDLIEEFGEAGVSEIALDAGSGEREVLEFIGTANRH